MADLLKTGAQWEADMRKAWRSFTVSVVRGVNQTDDVLAAAGQTTTIAQGADGMVFEERTRDFLINVADYQILGSPVEPEENDRILDSSSGTAKIYQVLKPAGQSEARWADPYGITWRVHTKEVGA